MQGLGFRGLGLIRGFQVLGFRALGCLGLRVV